MNAVKQDSFVGVTSLVGRTLSSEECLVVAGGIDTIVVTGGRPAFQPDYAGNFWMFGGTGGFRVSYEHWEPGDQYASEPVTNADPGDGIFNDTMETAAAEGLEGFAAVLKAMMDKHGGDFDVKLPNGTIYKASSLIAGSSVLGVALAAHEGYGHYQDLMDGDPNVAAIIGFVGGLAVGAGAATLGMGPLAAFAAGMGVKYGVEYGLPAIANAVAAAGEQIGIYLDQTSDAIFDGAYDPNAPSSIQIWQVLTSFFNPYGSIHHPDPNEEFGPPGGHPW